jgi:hypothetical protein
MIAAIHQPVVFAWGVILGSMFALWIIYMIHNPGKK